MRFDSAKGFRSWTTKKLHLRSIIVEVVVPARRDQHRPAHENGCSIWDEWADHMVNWVPSMAKQWRSSEVLESIDQISSPDRRPEKPDPNSRRHIVSA
jgi:thymidylate synthase